MGFERRVLCCLPELLLAGVVPPAAGALILQDPLAQILALAFTLAWWMSLVPLALACLVVAAMKGPRRVADCYPMPEA